MTRRSKWSLSIYGKKILYLPSHNPLDTTIGRSSVTSTCRSAPKVVVTVTLKINSVSSSVVVRSAPYVPVLVERHMYCFDLSVQLDRESGL
jgi:hypothetical protein